MKRFLIPSLVIVHLLLHALAVWPVMQDRLFVGGWTDYFLYPLFMLGPSQGALLAVWIALGRRGTPWRVALAAIGTVAYLVCFHHADDEWLAMMIGEMAFMVALLLCARLTGLELTRSEQQPSVRPRFQFFIRDMLAWTTALAVVLSAGQVVVLYEWYPAYFHYAVGESLVVVGILSFVALVSLWAALGQRWFVVRVILPPAAVGAGAAIPASLFPHSIWFSAMMLGLMAVWITGSLLVVRWAGYGLSWQWRFSREAIE